MKAANEAAAEALHQHGPTRSDTDRHEQTPRWQDCSHAETHRSAGRRVAHAVLDAVGFDALVEAAYAVLEAWEGEDVLGANLDSAIAYLDDALARLDAVTGGEPSTSQCCRDNVPHAGGFHQEGEVWCCPECGTGWVHVIEESEGAWWQRRFG